MSRQLQIHRIHRIDDAIIAIVGAMKRLESEWPILRAVPWSLSVFFFHYARFVAGLSRRRCFSSANDRPRISRRKRGLEAFRRGTERGSAREKIKFVVHLHVPVC